ncbi:hypothetical protein HYFRA_00006612 [Hymenoscyphus fraxineus]|uniref:CUE domain-containing protein n=1 Tax=Hymenoscyphus fraxineus TaxID=746836 RepID=A0A9N9PSS2_9HELO|nr:hypothetical protein HYFRA_00006612 [Hymenoscyphus fraxineus]
MSDNPLKNSSVPESPTTVQPFDMDDDDVQETGVLSSESTTAPKVPKPATVEDAPPPKPPRPLSAQQQTENTLKEAFPSVELAVIKAVLRASGGRVEAAFNALLEMTDPDAVIQEEIPPPQPPRPAPAAQSQLEADEQYARQLAEQYGGGGSSYAPRTSSRGDRGDTRARQQRQNEFREEEHSFLDDDLPIIKENLKKGFLETQTVVNSWITNLKKKIDGDDGPPPNEMGYSTGPDPYRGRRGEDSRQSGDYARYDADPHVLGDDFAGIQLNEDGSAARRSTRPLANPDLFKPTPTPPKSTDGRKVAFQSRPIEDLDIYNTSPKPGAAKEANAGKQSKWQPLSAVDPNPVGEADNDPFSLGDSEDEKESKDRVGGKEVNKDDAERLKKAAAEAMADSIGEPARKPEAAETVGTKDKIADEKLSGKS